MTDLPIKGMTVRPDDCDGREPALGWPGFLGAVSYCAGQREAVEQFEKDTGISLSVAFRRDGISMIVDKACGFDPRAEVMAKFADWVAVNVWGVEEPDLPEGWGELPDVGPVVGHRPDPSETLPDDLP